ncbi:MAG: hypothetical protein HY706_07330 [Candidatus Hydrogenedentes bacterium]|nr:hypothetical protein [Candidatus Hydrogenedentota bacterium]
MLSVIEVKCPHCGAQGQIMMPPLGAIIIGPCPQCHGLVVIFCGRVLPLDGDIMQHGATRERREHLMSVLTRFLEQNVAQIIDSLSAELNKISQSAGPPATEPAQSETAGDLSDAAPSIPDTEVERFLQQELPMLDDKNYFRAIFG